MPSPLRSPRGRAATAAAIALLVLHAALAWWYHVDALSIGHDDAVYLVLGRSLRALEYRDLHRAGAPAHAVYPPGYPALLAVVGAAVGERLPAFVAAQVLTSVAGLLAAFAAVRRLWSDVAAVGVLALLALNPLLVRSASVLLTDTPLVALVAIALWGTVRRAAPAPPGAAGVATDPGVAWPGAAAMAIVAAAALAAPLTRTAGIGLSAGIVLWALGERRWRPALALAGATAALVAVWVAHVLGAAAAGGATYARDYHNAVATVAARDTLAVATPDSSTIMRVVGAARYAAGTVRDYLTGDLPTALALPMRGGLALDNVAWALVLAAAGSAGAWWLWRRWRAAAWFVACYAVVLVVWPWSLARFLAPLLPVLFPLLLAGAAVVGRRAAGERGRRWAPAALWSVLLVGAATGTGRMLRERVACEPAGDVRSSACWRSDRGAFATAVAVAAAESGPDAVVITPKPATAYVEGGRRTFALPALRDPGFLDAALARHGEVLAIVGGVEEEPDWMNSLLAGQCDRFRIVRHVARDTYVLRALPPGERGDACTADAP